MNRIIRIYIFGQWHIALAALVYYYGGTFILGGRPDPITGVHIFAATLSLYLVHRLYNGRKYPDTSAERYTFLFKYLNDAKATAIAGGLIAVVSFFFLDWHEQILLIISGIVCVAYVLPLIFKKRLRDLGILKIFLISLVWAVIPILSVYREIDSGIAFLFYIENFLFIFALTIPFDIRDQGLDARSRVSNLALSFSLDNLKATIIYMLFSCLLILMILYVNSAINLSTLILLITLYIIQLIKTVNVEKMHEEIFYLFVLDGFILIKGLIFLIGAATLNLSLL